MFGRRIQHPFYPALKPSRALKASGRHCALAGSSEELLLAARAGVVVTRAVFPLHEPAAPWLTQDQRDLLWDLFQVPVFAMLLDARGRVIGCECEVQEGFHVFRAGPLPLGTVTTGPCECGRPGPRLLPQPAALETAAVAVSQGRQAAAKR